RGGNHHKGAAAVAELVMTLQKIDAPLRSQSEETIGDFRRNDRNLRIVLQQRFDLSFGNRSSADNGHTLAGDIQGDGVELHCATTLKKSAIAVANGPSFGLSGTMRAVTPRSASASRTTLPTAATITFELKAPVSSPVLP